MPTFIDIGAVAAIEAEIERLDRERIAEHLGADALDFHPDELAEAWESYYAGDTSAGDHTWGWEAECAYDEVSGRIAGLQFALAVLRREAKR